MGGGTGNTTGGAGRNAKILDHCALLYKAGAQSKALVDALKIPDLSFPTCFYARRAEFHKKFHKS